MAVVLEMYIDSYVAQLVNNLPSSAGDESDVGLIPGKITIHTLILCDQVLYS